MGSSKFRKFNRLQPQRNDGPSVEKTKAFLKEFDPQGVLDDYIAQDPRHHSKNLDPKQIFDIEDRFESQAERVVKKFGGVAPLLAAFAAIGKPRTRASVYKWTWDPKRGGTGGLIPTRVWPDLLMAARIAGIFITAEDFDARTEHIRKFKTVATTIDGRLVPYIDSRSIKELKRAELKRRRKIERKKLQTKKRQELRKQKLAEARILKKIERELKKAMAEKKKNVS